MAAAATTTVEVSDDGDHPVLRDDERGIPRSLSLLAAIVEADAARHAAAATRPAESDLVRAFRGGATPTVAIGEFLERIHAFVRLESVRHDIRLQATCYVLAGIYLTRFLGSAAAVEAGIRVDPSTAHRLVAAAVFVGAKFGNTSDMLPTRWTSVFETSSDAAIHAGEMAGLERRFLRAVDYRLFVRSDRFGWFCGAMEQALHRSVSRSRKRTAAEAVGGEEGEDERRRRRRHSIVGAFLPPLPAVAAN
ncbi:cyclin-P4-1-like [Oryza sativa Japonica Group]|jgi:hypothetical protein|uniref:Os07g0231500 protein n=2 Tax=Oryza sativa subsp. japonica TaxID=39947 RepID=Q0D7M5_ORYSJ|nr:cyclin-P4-1-like [Oryza sativa Japonica Group]KAB8104843.1 hypothetical protein EE612_038034 [Oryza sativa]EEE66839.1 hypothetical protein OsJ_23619 [Oryza sativa Japonica Group]KAF2922044.1 hypothetical protein DAI22_07g081300 [Oryza sativa Japonica Group]BAC84454.1 unknown protein [Oryza sativa Japonica Group]BAF21148.1 Os07g0231500 [Oryza sativa Japonica Group]|eukprot:NP_001059234.1 Os07g0231500 [Oryza sativa Japonica Group]